MNKKRNEGKEQIFEVRDGGRDKRKEERRGS